MIDVTKSWNCSDVTYTTLSLEDFFADIKEQALGLAEIYHQKINWKAQHSDKKVTIAYDPMFRAVMNVIQNAVEHTKENGIIYIDAKEQDDRLTFLWRIADQDLQKKHYCMAQSSFLWMTQVEMAKPIMGWDYFLQKLWLKNMVEGLNFQILKKNTGGARVEIFS